MNFTLSITNCTAADIGIATFAALQASAWASYDAAIALHHARTGRDPTIDECEPLADAAFKSVSWVLEKARSNFAAEFDRYRREVLPAMFVSARDGREPKPPVLRLI
jgi:hypothetical protein